MVVIFMPSSVGISNGNGIFITFEGGEGAGKSTQIKLLKEHLEQNGFDVLLVREPGATPIGEKIRAILLDKEQDEMSLITELFLYEAARAQIVQDVIKPALKAGRVVLCDRFIDSTVAYQGFGRGIDPALIEQLNSLASANTVPDCTILLQINPEQGVKRAAEVSSGGADRIEGAGMEFHKRVHEGFENLAKTNPQRVHVVQAQQSIECVQNEIWKHIAKIFPETKAPNCEAAKKEQQ
jgi:dTMP kinase